MREWHSLNTAPKDRKIDLWAKAWLPKHDRFEHQRFPDCRWDTGDSVCNRGPSWSGLPKEWHPTHWMERPEGPAEPAMEPDYALAQSCAEGLDHLAESYVRDGFPESASAIQFAAGYIRDRFAADLAGASE